MDTTCVREPDSTAPCPAGGAVEAASPPKSGVILHCLAVDAPTPVTVLHDSWLRLEAKPKDLVSSTPSHHKS